MKFLLVLLTTFMFNSYAQAADFVACESTYALCTTAKCDPIIGGKGDLLCHCDVKTGFSVSEKQCSPIENKDQGQIINSRYYPVKGYVVCSNANPWALCLDKPCLIDKADPTKADCRCTQVKSLGDYVSVSDQGDKSTCNEGIISSATVQQITQITDFLKTQPQLPPFPITVINP